MTGRADEPGGPHAKLRNEFDAWAEAGRGEAMEKGHLPTARQALERVPFDAARPETFLDLGCGNGYIVRLAAERLHPAGTAIGLDVSPRMLAEAERATERFITALERTKGRAPSVRFVEGAFEDLPLEPASVDHCYSNEAIYYSPDIDRALAEILRILKPGGTFHCSLDFFEENTYSHDWQDKVGLPMMMDNADGWVTRFRAAGFVDVSSDRLLDPTEVPPIPDEADEEARTRHGMLAAWKREVGTLLVVGRKPTP